MSSSLRRFVFPLPLAAILALGSLTGASADTSDSLSIGNAGADGEVWGGFENDLPHSFCVTGMDSLSSFSVREYRWALELPLDDLPPTATITSASLALRTSRHDLAGQTAIYGYAGDGSVTLADVGVTGTPVLFTPASVSRLSYDVTSLLTPAVVAAGWAGFSFRQQPLGTTFAAWDCPNNGSYPILTINYTLPDDAQPDARIKRSGGALLGNDVYNTTGVNQAVWLNLRAGSVRRVYVTVQNDSTEADSFGLELSGAVPAGFQVSYYRGRSMVNLTSAVEGGTFVTPVLQPGQKYKLRLRIVVTGTAAKGSVLKRLLTFISENNGAAQDAVLLTVKRR